MDLWGASYGAQQLLQNLRFNLKTLITIQNQAAHMCALFNSAYKNCLCTFTQQADELKCYCSETQGVCTIQMPPKPSALISVDIISIFRT